MGVQIEEKNQVLYLRLNLFEIGLFFAGLALMIVGFFLLRKQYLADGYFSWGLLQGIFLWLILIVIVIIAAILENVKEELAVVIKEHITETKLLRQETTLLKDCIKRKR